MWVRHESDGTCRETTMDDPSGRFHADLIWALVPPEFRPWVTSGWIVTNGVVGPPTLDYLVDQLLGALAARGESEASRGAVMPDGYRVDTSERGRSLMLGAFLRAQRLATTQGPDAPIRWKVSRRVFEAAPASVVMDRGRLAIDHVQACIDREYSITTAILAAAEAADTTAAAVVAVYAAEIDSGWPSDA